MEGLALVAEEYPSFPHLLVHPSEDEFSPSVLVCIVLPSLLYEVTAFDWITMTYAAAPK